MFELPKVAVGGYCAFCGDVTVAASETVPVNPPVPPIVKTSVAALPRVIVSVDAAADAVIAAGALTTSAIGIDAVRLPDVPVTVTEDDPATAFPDAENVI